MTTNTTICEHGVDIWASACGDCPERPSYNQGVRWGVKHNTVSSGYNGEYDEYPYWIATVDSEERAHKFYEEEYKHAQRKFPNQPDRLPEIVRMDVIWTKVYP